MSLTMISNEKKRKKVAIVGMGVTGVSVLREWTREKEKGRAVDITVFGDEKTFGRGFPYQKEDDLIIMNQPADLATIIPEEKDDFVHWLKEKGEKDPRKGYYPRAVFGNYLNDRMKSWLEQSKARVIKEKVETIRPLDGHCFRVCSTSLTEDFDYVHLCVGNAPYEDDYNLVHHSHFIANPFPLKEKLQSIPFGVSLGILGTGLTSIDILRYAREERPDLSLSFYSQSGRFKTARGETIPYTYKYFTEENIKKTKEKNDGWISLTTYLNWMIKEINHQGIQLEHDWWFQDFGSIEKVQRDIMDPYILGVVQTLILGLDPFLTEMWGALTEKDKNRFMEDYGEIWDKVRSSFPKESGEILVEEWKKEAISVYGKVHDVIKRENHFEVLLEKNVKKEVEYLINATGSIKNVDWKIGRMPLLAQLLSERVLQPEVFGGVQVTMPNLSAISQRYGVLHQFKVHGPLIAGIQFGNNSIDILSETAQTAVQSIIQKDFS